MKKGILNNRWNVGILINKRPYSTGVNYDCSFFHKKPIYFNLRKLRSRVDTYDASINPRCRIDLDLDLI